MTELHARIDDQLDALISGREDHTPDDLRDTGACRTPLVSARSALNRLDFLETHMSAPSFSLIDRPATWVALAGFMGTGKSRIGWELSRALALHFVDTDKLIARVSGRTVPEIFEREGESRFRLYEREVVNRVVRLDYAVVSLGGGTFVSPENRRVLLERGPVVVLWASPETILGRTRREGRPLLQAEEPLERIRGLMAEREGAYREGTIHVSSDGRPSEEVVAEIIDHLWAWQEQVAADDGQGDAAR